MQRLGVALAGLCIVASAAAAETMPPPARFDHAHPKLHVLERDYYEVDPHCRKMFPRANFPPVTGDHRILGCAGVGDGVRACWIIVPAARDGLISEDRRAEIVRHERAHCNGWPSSHPH